MGRRAAAIASGPPPPPDAAKAVIARDVVKLPETVSTTLGGFALSISLAIHVNSD
jgi:hypothetical protein